MITKIPEMYKSPMHKVMGGSRVASRIVCPATKHPPLQHNSCHGASPAYRWVGSARQAAFDFRGANGKYSQIKPSLQYASKRGLLVGFENQAYYPINALCSLRLALGIATNDGGDVEIAMFGGCLSDPFASQRRDRDVRVHAVEKAQREVEILEQVA